MDRHIPVSQARAELADLVNRVAYSGERITLTRHGRSVAGLVPAEDLARLEAWDRPRAVPSLGRIVTPDERRRDDLAAEDRQPPVS